MAAIRLILSGIIAFSFYAAWAYYANSLVTDDQSVLIKAALVQGSYSGGITLFFTFILEFLHSKFGHSNICIAFLMPRWPTSNKQQSCETDIVLEEVLSELKQSCSGNYIPGMLLVPLPALVLQTILVVAVNLAFETPNLWLTVAPSIVFSAIYGYSYSIALSKRQQRSKVTNS
ncbi:hypothetical protein [Glaciecola sp. SC05]|uniref:hypothetical protein n=1 Tax=Glaciecola sp. SC05 TaxID=1987355 RepID=UPI003529AF54